MKKFYIFLSVLLLSLFWLVGTCSFAAVEKLNQMTISEYNGTFKDLVSSLTENYYDLTIEEYEENITQTTTVLNNFNYLLTDFNDSNFISYYATVTSNSNNTSNVEISVQFSTKNTWTSAIVHKYSLFKLKSNTTWNVTRTTSTANTVGGSGNRFLYYNNEWYFGNNRDFTPVLALNFSPLSNIIKNIGGINFYIQNFTRYETFFKIGQILNFDYREEYRGICAMLVNGVYQNSNIQLYINPNGEVFVYTSNLLFNQGYGFKFFNGDLETDIYNFYFIPNGSSSGDINSSGDYVYNGFDNNDIVPIANLINDQYSVNSGEMSAYIDSLFSSGDLSPIADAYDFDSFENNYFNYLYGFFTNIINTLTSEGDVTLPITYRSFSYNLKSSDFYVPNSPLKTLVTTILIVFCFFLVYQQLDKMFKHIRTTNTTKRIKAQFI